MPIPRPPRLTGSNQVDDSAALSNWMFEVWKSFELTQEFVRTAEAFQPAGFDPNTLPDPASSSIPQAQQTANEAFALAAYAYSNSLDNASRLDAMIFGTVTITGTATSGNAAFAEAQEDAVYSLVLSPESIVGTPDPEAFHVTDLALTAAGFTVTVAVAPGTGNSVTFNYHLRR